MNQKILLLIPQFTDRGGRTVYYIHERAEGRYITPGKMLGEIRMAPPEEQETNGSLLVEWIFEQEKSPGS